MEHENFPSLSDIENESEEEGKEKGGGEKGHPDKEKGAKYAKENSLEEEANICAEMEVKAEGKQKLPEGYYEVEAIRGKRHHKGQLQYLIKWRDYPETENTWEPHYNIIYCADISQNDNCKSNNALPKKYSVQTEDGRDGTAARKFGEENSPVYVVEERKGKANGTQKLDEDFYEAEAIRKKCNQNDRPQYLIKRRDLPETSNTCEPLELDNIKKCSDLLEAFDQSSWKTKHKRNSALSKKKHSLQTKDSSPPSPSSSKGMERGIGSGTACSPERDIIVYKRRKTCSSERNIIFYHRRKICSSERERIVHQRRHKLSIDGGFDKKEKNIMKDQTEKEKATEDAPTTNKVPASLPEVKKRVKGMNNGGRNFVMQDYVRKQREKEEAKSGVGSTYFSIFYPNYKENTERDGEAPPLPPFVRSMPDFYDPPQPQGSKASTRLTGAKRRKSGRVRRFIHPEEEAKKTMNAEIVEPTEGITTPSAVDTASNSNSGKATEEVQGSQLVFRSNPI